MSNTIRTGPNKALPIKFGSEERFSWQKPNSVDVSYDIPSTINSKNVFFGSAPRDPSFIPASEKSKAVGPGSYDYRNSIQHVSQYTNHDAVKFGTSARPNLVMKTPSPGAIYNLGSSYYMGQSKQLAIGFNCDQRKPLPLTCSSLDADLFVPHSESGPAISIGKKLSTKSPSAFVPGPIYDVHKKVNFKTGPSFSFGKGAGKKHSSRFLETGFMPDTNII